MRCRGMIDVFDERGRLEDWFLARRRRRAMGGDRACDMHEYGLMDIPLTHNCMKLPQT